MNIKKTLSVLAVSLLAVLVLALPARAATIVHEGEAGGCSWTIDSDGLLRIYPTDGVSGELIHNGNTEFDTFNWVDYSTEVKRAVVEDGVWGVSLERMFSGCSYMTSVDLSGLDTSKVENMEYIFSGCKALQSIYVGDGWSTESVTSSWGMFAFDDNLVGCSGTRVQDLSGKTNLQVACVDTFETPGLLSKEGVGWIADETGTYHLYNGDGSLRTNNWARYKGVYFYLGEDGLPVSNEWQKGIDGKYYYLGSDGSVVLNGAAPAGSTYYVIKGGSVDTTPGWKKVNGGYYYVGKDGTAYAGRWFVENGKYYYFGADAKLVVNGVVYDGEVRYYMGSDGLPVKDCWVKAEGDWSYINGEYQMVTNAWVYYNRYYYLMDGYGHPIRNQKNYEWYGFHFNFDAYGRCTWSDLG